MRRSWWRLAALLVFVATTLLVTTAVAQANEDGGGKSAAAPNGGGGGNGNGSDDRKAQSNSGEDEDSNNGKAKDGNDSKDANDDDGKLAVPKLPDNGGAGGADGSLGWQECFDFLKSCRDEKCAYRNYTANCVNGGKCTCVGHSILGADATANFVRIERFAFAVLIILIAVTFGTWSQ